MVVDYSDNQIVFDLVVKHLRNANGRSINSETNSCSYRGDNGNKCAIGCLIPDELYDPEMDDTSFPYSTSIFSIISRFPQIEQLFKDTHIMLLTDLQQIHDNENNWSASPDSKFVNVEELVVLGKSYNLSIQVVLDQRFII